MYIHHVNNKFNSLLPWILPLVMYGLLIFAHGYVYGYGDQMDFMPYALQIQGTVGYENDFYINCIKGHLNERWFIAHALAGIPERAWPLLFIALHFLASLVLIQGMLKFCKYAGLVLWAQWAVIGTCLVLLYHRNLGGNELYYNMVTPSLLAKSIGIWSLWYASQQAKWRAAWCCIIATYIHPVAGAQVFLLSMILIGNSGRILFILTTLTFVLPYLLPLYFQLDQVTENVSLAEVMQLRNPHHFMPSHFGWSNIRLLSPLYLFGTALAYKLDRPLFNIMAFIIAGCLMYVLLLGINPELSYKTQWFKSTIWLKFFSLLIIARWLNQRIRDYPKLSFLHHPILVIGIFMAVLVMVIRHSRFASYTFPRTPPTADQLVAREAKSVSQPEDVFLVPANFTAFKYYSRRSTWVDWKAIPHQSTCLSLWADKIKLAYGLNTGYQGDLNTIYSQSNRYLGELSPEGKLHLKSLGVTYLIFRPENKDGYSIEKL